MVARTGQRYIDGMASDEALFKYLMDNAIAYKDSHQLQLGVGLSAEQVAALTHDIVWLEEATINGEKVLVPVLYLARRVTGNVTSVTQHGSDVQVGGNLELNAGRDLSAVASRIDAARDIAMSAGRDVVLASAANEEHSDAKYKGGKRKGTDLFFYSKARRGVRFRVRKINLSPFS